MERLFNPHDYLADPIHGDKFSDACDFTLNDRSQRLDGILDRNGTVFCRTDNLPDLFGIIKKSKYNYIVVSGNSDFNITETSYMTKPQNVLYWAGQNSLTKEVGPIPIGLERPGIGGSGNVDDLLDNLSGDLNKEMFCYANFSNGTNPIRPFVKSWLKNHSWCEVQEERTNFKDFLRKLKKAELVICPPGNGSDTHRMWEALYAGSIPVCDNSYHNVFMSKFLPVIVYNNIEELNFLNLTNELLKVKAKLDAGGYTLEFLSFYKWKNLLRVYADSLLIAKPAGL